MKIKLVVLAVITSSILLAGCGDMSRRAAHIIGHTRHCIDHVSYLQFPSGVTVEYDAETGEIKRC